MLPRSETDCRKSSSVGSTGCFGALLFGDAVRIGLDGSVGRHTTVDVPFGLIPSLTSL